MNCVYTYNGRDYSYAEFAAALHEGLLEDLSGKGDVVLDVEIPKIQISQKEGMGYGANDVIGNVVKTGVQDVFNSNPELASIGTQEQYSKYLDTIFPDSKIKDIVYHVTTEKFDKFDPEKQVTAGYYFTEKEPRYKGVIKEVSKKDEVILSALIDTKNPLEENTDFISESINDISHLEGFKKEGYDAIIDRKGHDEVIVFEPEQIHILGSKQDIEGFGKFVARDGETVGEGNAQKEEVAEKEEEKEVREKTTKDLRKEALSIDAFDAQDFVLQYFAGGGKIHPKVLRSIYGVKNNEEATKRKVRDEQRVRLGLLSSKAKAKTPDAIAEQVYNEVPGYLRDTISLSEVHDAVIDVINSYVSVKQMSKALIDKYADKEAMIQKASESRQSAAFYEDLTDEEVDAAMETPEIIEAAELTYDALSDEQRVAFDELIERFTVDGVTDYDAINKAMEDFNFEADEIFVFNVNQLLDNNLKSVLDDYQKRSQNQDIIGEDANKEGVAQKELAEQTRAAEEALISARKDYDNKKRQLGKDLLAEQPEMFEEKDETVLFETDANVSQANIDAILKPYADAVKLAQARVDELTSPAMLEKAKSADALQARLSLDQEVINNAMDAANDGIQDMTLDDMENNGIIKRDCE